MNHTQLALLDELLADGALKRDPQRRDGWLIGNAQDEEVVAVVTELADADGVPLHTQAGTIGVRFSEAIRAYIG